MYKLIAETKNKFYDMVVSPISKYEGLRYADRLSVSPYLSQKELSEWMKKSDNELYDLMWNLFDWLTLLNKNLKKIAKDMVNHFLYSRGTYFTNNELNTYISSNLYFHRWANYIIENKIGPVVLKNRLTPSKMFTEYITIPSFAFGHNLKGYKRYNIIDEINNNRSMIEGLPIMINQVWAATVEIDNIQIYSPKRFSANLRFTLYDDFGLDKEDLRKHYQDSIPPKAGKGFIAWYILQHYHANHRPFITKIVIEKHLTYTVKI